MLSLAFSKWVLVFLLFFIAPILFTRLMVRKTIEVQPTQKKRP